MKGIGNPKSQRGATLVVSLVLLLALTVVGIASMREAVVQQKVINSLVEDDTAFQAAEFALRMGEQLILQMALDDPLKLLSGDQVVGDISYKVYDSRNNELDRFWWKDDHAEIWDFGVDASAYPAVTTAQTKPSFVIEMLGKDRIAGGSVDLGNNDEHTVMNFRVTARGFGANEAFFVVLQSTVGVQL